MLAAALVVVAAASSAETAGTLTITFDDSTPALTNATSGTIGFTVDDPNAVTSCAFSDLALEPCTSPYAWSDLSDGEHVLRVTADNTAANNSGEATFTFTTDTTPPSAVALTEPGAGAVVGPTVTLAANATGADAVVFRWAPANKDSWFTIGTDSDPPFTAQWAPSDVTIPDDYQLDAIARDAAGNTLESEPVVVHLQSGPGPKLAIVAPASPSDSPDGSIAFGGAGAVGFRCRLDDADLTSCETPYGYHGLADGTHTLEVEATDDAGNISTASVEWVVDTVAPTVEITDGPAAMTPDDTVTFAFDSDDTTATFLCTLDDKDPVGCASPYTLSELKLGEHTLTVEADDAAGNSSTADWSWTSAVPLPPSLGGTTERVSVASDGSEGDGTSEDPSISSDGRYVAFTSAAADLVTGDENGLPDVFVRDRLTGTTTRVSLAITGGQANGASSDPSISADGRLVAFTSAATNLVSGDDNGAPDVFVRDLDTGTTTLVSADPNRGVGNRGGNQPALSADGRFVAFTSASTDIGGDDSGNENVYRRDLANSTTTMVSVNLAGRGASGGRPSISGDGNLVAFETAEPGLVDGDANGAADIFVRDMSDGVTRIVTHAFDGGPTNGFSDLAAISADGSTVAFRSFATNLIADDANGGTADAYVADLGTGAIELASVDGNGTQGTDATPYVTEISISGDGRYVGFVSGNSLDLADALSPPEAKQLYVRDRQLGTTVDVSRSGAGDPANAISWASSISEDGRHVAFGSSATNLVEGDGNGVDDVFVRDLLGTSTLTATVTVEADPAQAPAGGAEVPYANVPRSVVGAATSGSDATESAPVESIPVESIPVESIPVESIPVESIPVESIPVESIGLTPDLLRRTIGGLPLNQVPLRDVPGGWPAVLQGTGLGGKPLQTVTLADVLALPAMPTKPDGAPLGLGDIDLVGTPLGGLPLAVLVLGGIDLADVPIDPGTDNLTAWCTLLKSLGASCSSPASLSGSSITSLALEGAPVESIPVESIPVESIPVESIPVESIPVESIPVESIPVESIPVESIPVESISIAGTPVESIPVESIAALVDCGGAFDCAGKLLGQAIGAGALEPGATLADLLDALGAKPSALDFDDMTIGQLLELLPDDFTVGQLLLMLMPASALPWEAVPLGHAKIQRFDTGGSSVHYRARFKLGGAPDGLETPASVRVRLPDGFAYVPGSSVLAHVTQETSDAIGDPVETDAGLVYALPSVVVGDTYEIGLDVRPGIDLGSTVGSASVSVGGESIADSGPGASVGVTDTFEPENGDPATAPALQADRFYLSHVQSAGDSDYYRFHAAGAGRVVFRLSHLAADFDLVVYGPERIGASQLPAGAALDGTPLPDGGLPVTGTAAALPAEAIQGEPLLDRPLWGFSINRDLSDESVSIDVPEDGGDFVVQVAGYNGAFSKLPYMLRVQRLSSPALPSTCAPVPKPHAVEAMTVASPGSATLGAVDTLLVTNMRRLGAVYGADGEQTVLDAVPANTAAFASSGHPLALLPVENDSTVAAAYAAWDASPCSVAAANAVVSAIVARIAAIRAAHPNIRYVALAGADSIVPFGRVDDLTTLANESGYLDTLAGDDNNEYLAAFGGRKLLSDAPYGDLGPTPFLSTQLYVPELPVGRLVESPAEIAQALERFGATDGLLDPSTAKTALTTGYDFLADGAEEIDSALQDVATTSTLISETWGGDDFLDALLPSGRGPDFGSLNAHYDHARLLPADRGALVDVGDLAGAGTKLTGSLLFSIGCHSGASVPDGLFASNTLDWAETYARRDAVWLAQTGYGLGDSAAVAYSERLAALYARALSTQNTVGDALVEAAQSYVGSQQVMGVYDAKAVEEATLYGLPTWSLAPNVERLSLRSGGPQPPETAPDPATGLDAAAVTADPVFPAGPTDTGDGTYWTVEGGGLTVEHYRPIEPNLVLPAPADARGAVITALTTTDHLGTVPAVSRPVVDSSAAEPAVRAGEVAFPTKLQTITHTTGPGGAAAASLVLGVGQFLSDPGTPGTGTQRNVVHAEATIYTGDDPGAAAPSIDRVDSVVLGSTVAFSVDAHAAAGDSVKRVLVLFRDERPAEPDGVHWLPVDLVASADGTHWTGGAPLTGDEAQFFVQVLSSAGTVSVSSNKGTNFQALPPVAPPPPPAGAGTITPSVDGPAAAAGWFAGAATVTLTQSLGLPMQYRVDGGPLTDYAGPFQVPGDGAHLVVASSGDGAAASFVVQVDATAPATVVATPAAGAEYTAGEVVRAAYSCPDAGSGAVTCDGDVAPGEPIDTTPGSHTFTVRSTDAAGNVAAPVVVAYDVVYRFSGFFSPIANDSVNSARAGQAIPVKFSLGGDQGLDIFAAGSPRSSRIDCQTGGSLNQVDETATPGKSSLEYDPSTDRYSYVWKTERTWKGTCRMLEVVTRDGVVHSARFEFR